MRKICLLSVSIILFASARAQKNGSVKGIVFDTLLQQPVSSVTITLLERKVPSLEIITIKGIGYRFVTG